MAQKYIVGDWVKFLSEKSKIIEVYEDGSYFMDSPNITGCPKEEELSPIPITPDILEKNGWDKEEIEGNIFSLSEAFLGGDKDDEDNYTHFSIFYNNEKDGWDIDMRGNPLKHEIHYVHELQHLLFGLNIEYEMEV